MNTKQKAVDVLAQGCPDWHVHVYPIGHGQWAYTAGPRSGTGFPTKTAAREAGERELAAALARCKGE